jgi:hypothetical protein
MPNEKLPTGFTRRASGSLRVQIRLKGHQPVVKNFGLLAGGGAERKRQMAEAEAWATETHGGCWPGRTSRAGRQSGPR